MRSGLRPVVNKSGGFPSYRPKSQSQEFSGFSSGGVAGRLDTGLPTRSSEEPQNALQFGPPLMNDPFLCEENHLHALEIFDFLILSHENAWHREFYLYHVDKQSDIRSRCHAFDELK